MLLCPNTAGKRLVFLFHVERRVWSRGLDLRKGLLPALPGRTKGLGESMCHEDLRSQLISLSNPYVKSTTLLISWCYICSSLSNRSSWGEGSISLCSSVLCSCRCTNISCLKDPMWCGVIMCRGAPDGAGQGLELFRRSHKVLESFGEQWSLVFSL